MEEELQKRFTDCVYFLASPLTCKKGMECEYRHSEIIGSIPGIAAIRNCAETSSEFAPPPNTSAVPVNKTNVPCYFYFNGYCNKGERCSYLHGPDDGTTAWKSSKIASRSLMDQQPRRRHLQEVETGPSAVEKHPDSSESGAQGSSTWNISSQKWISV
ncbi:hypothetical protein HAX54_015095 [Datura stramonium]|uniref:C3H1-type domain-containing protein n=1 Tax=Datura stramonium TaxID=4076 RepID=A0ABS8TR34_DATST|nr:hypothetical protein [Datura stramonium]